MITKHPWFGPKTGMGWGWTPVSWEGWLVTGLCLAVFLGAYFVFGRAPMTTYVMLGSVAALIIACLLTGTAPADSAAHSALAAARSILACCS